MTLLRNLRLLDRRLKLRELHLKALRLVELSRTLRRLNTRDGALQR